MPTSIYNKISNTASRAFVSLFPTMGGVNIPNQSSDQRSGQGDLVRNLSRYISPVQIQRIKQDVQTWRDAMAEMENAWYPQRFKAQRLFMDTVLNGHVFSCMDRRLKLTTLKKYQIVNIKTRKVNEEATLLLKKQWFKQYMKNNLESKAYGYTLMYLGDLVDSNFPNSSIIRRANISPDRLNVQQFPYSISGAPFTVEPYVGWHIWMPTPSDAGVSSCGYGYLYNVGLYEIFARNLLSQNIDATELFGMPIRVGKTSKTQESEERAIFEQALAEMGSAGYLLLDAIGDSVELMESKSLGQGYKIYESLEKRLEAKISKIILGHADALDSTPGKLGNDTKESPAQKAMQDICTVDMNDLVDCTNNQLLPKLRNIGMTIFGEDEEFEFDNNEELKEVEDEENERNNEVATIYQLIKQAGMDGDPVYFTKRTGIPVVKTVVPVPIAPGSKPGEEDSKPKPGLKQTIKARLEKLYEHKH